MKKITNVELLENLELSKLMGEPIPDLCQTFEAMITRYIKIPTFDGFSENLKATMEVEAYLMCIKYWNTFDATKSQNPFAYFTHAINGSFVQCLATMKRRGIV